jgi:hypothetical protein
MVIFKPGIRTSWKVNELLLMKCKRTRSPSVNYAVQLLSGATSFIRYVYCIAGYVCEIRRIHPHLRPHQVVVYRAAPAVVSHVEANPRIVRRQK